MGVGSATSWSDYPILGPYSIAVTGLTTVAQQVLAADSGCKGVIFHNPGSKAKRILLPVRHLHQWIEQNILLILKDAPFSKTDPNVNPAAGACVESQEIT